MVVAYIEIERDENWKGKGNINLIPKREYWAILHGYGPVERTIFMVDTSQENIDKVKNSHKDIKVYTTKKQMQLRGLEIRPGTPTLEETASLVKDLKIKYNIDLKAEINSKTSKTWEQSLKDTEHIGIGKIKCTNCETINEDIRSHCTNCDAFLAEHGKSHTPPFDIRAWPR